jgi:dipeptidyl aminopeptidase/acylaminoacyl peptidase
MSGNKEPHSATTAVSSLAFSPDGRTLVASQKGILTFWDSSTRHLSEGMPQVTRAVAFAFSPDGKTLAYTTNGEVLLWDRGEHREAGRIKPADGAFGIAYSPDSKHLVVGGDKGLVTLWDISSPSKPLREVHGSTYPVRQVALSPDGQLVAAKFDDGPVRVWDGGLNAELSLNWDAAKDMPRATAFAFSPDGRFLAVGLDGGYDPTNSRVLIKGGFIRLWEVKTEDGARQFKELPLLRGHREEITSLAFSHDSRTLYSSDGDGTAKLWDMISFREMISIHDDYIYTTAAAFSPDGRMLAFGDWAGYVRLWDAAEKEEMRFRQTGGPPAPPPTRPNKP